MSERIGRSNLKEVVVQELEHERDEYVQDDDMMVRKNSKENTLKANCCTKREGVVEKKLKFSIFPFFHFFQQFQKSRYNLLKVP